MNSGFQIGFELVDIAIGEYPNGLAVKSAVVESRAAPGSLRMLISVVQQAIIESENPKIRPFADGPLVKAVSDEVVRHRYYLRMAEQAEPGEDAQKLAERQRKAFNRAVDSAVAQEVLMAGLLPRLVFAASPRHAFGANA